MDNEEKACGAIVRILEQRTGETRTKVRCPEKEHVGPPVDLRLVLGAQEYAIEHTRIEPFEKEIRSGVRIEKTIPLIKTRLSGELPGPGWFRLELPPILGKEILCGRVLDTLCESIRENARYLHERDDRSRQWHHPNKFTDPVGWAPPGLGYEVTLRRCPSAVTPGPMAGSIEVLRTTGSEAQRKARLERALRDKCPKLQDCKTEKAELRTILVLESNDIANTDVQVVAKAFGMLRQQCANDLEAVDEIYLIQTWATPWIVWLLKCDTAYRPVDPRSEWRPKWNYVELDEDDLIDLKHCNA